MEPCAERDKLREVAGEALDDIINFTERLRKAVKSEGPWGSLSPLDQDLENAVGARKELSEHSRSTARNTGATTEENGPTTTVHID